MTFVFGELGDNTGNYNDSVAMLGGLAIIGCIVGIILHFMINKKSPRLKPCKYK